MTVLIKAIIMIIIIVTDKIVMIIMISIMILMNTSGFLSIYYEPEESAALILMKYPLTFYKTQTLLALTQPTCTEVSTCSLFPALLSLVVLPGVRIWQESRGVWAAHWMYCMTPLLLPPLSIGEDRERDLHTMRKRQGFAQGRERDLHTMRKRKGFAHNEEEKEICKQ
jgi:hypothetical protein